MLKSGHSPLDYQRAPEGCGCFWDSLGLGLSRNSGKSRESLENLPKIKRRRKLEKIHDLFWPYFLGVQKTDPVRFEWGFGEGLLKDKFAFFEVQKILYLRGEICLQNAHFYKQEGPCLKRPVNWAGSVFLLLSFALEFRLRRPKNGPTMSSNSSVFYDFIHPVCRRLVTVLPTLQQQHTSQRKGNFRN